MNRNPILKTLLGSQKPIAKTCKELALEGLKNPGFQSQETRPIKVKILLPTENE